MQYVVVELQDNGTTVANNVWAFSDVSVAEQKFHMVAAAAAVSNVPYHSAVMLNSHGEFIKREPYEHDASQEE